MDLRKLSVTLIVIAMVSMGFGSMISENVQGAFIVPLSNSGLPADFVVHDVTWNDAGTMAVVVGYDSMGMESNAFAYYPANDTYWPIDNHGNNNQRLYSVDYYNSYYHNKGKKLYQNLMKD